MWPNPQETADVVTFTEEILNGKLDFLCNPEIYSEPNRTSEMMFYCEDS